MLEMRTVKVTGISILKSQIKLEAVVWAPAKKDTRRIERRRKPTFIIPFIMIVYQYTFLP